MQQRFCFLSRCIIITRYVVGLELRQGYGVFLFAVQAHAPVAFLWLFHALELNRRETTASVRLRSERKPSQVVLSRNSSTRLKIPGSSYALTMPVTASFWVIISPRRSSTLPDLGWARWGFFLPHHHSGRCPALFAGRCSPAAGNRRQTYRLAMSTLPR
jgi:hypothetical protein